jgi:hypothetical protein
MLPYLGDIPQSMPARKTPAPKTTAELSAPKRKTMAELAAAINAYILEMQTADEATKPTGFGAAKFYHGGARAVGAYVAICYISYQNTSNVPRADAEYYLAWLDIGKRGKHWVALRERDGRI